LNKKQLADKAAEKVQTFFAGVRARWWVFLLAFIIPTLITWGFASRYKIGINLDHSLTCRLFIVEKGVMPVKGECIAFRCKDLRPYFQEGIMFIKRLVGIPGDRIEVSPDGKSFYLNGKFVARAKDTDKQGNPVAPARFEDKTLCPTCYFVLGDHPRSYDSRYWGYMWKDQIVGKATCLF